MQGLHASLTEAVKKLTALDHTLHLAAGQSTGPIDLGMPVLSPPST